MHRKLTRHICLECSKKQATCCSLGVPLTIEDVNRITALGYKLENFAEPGEWKKDEIEGNEDWWENSMVEVDGKMYRLHVKESGEGDDEKCFFLKEGEGCVLGDKRPLHCKMYPFWIDEGHIAYDDPEDKFCPLNKGIMPLKESMELLHETEESLKEHYQKIKEDCIKNKEKHKELILKLLKAK